VGCAPARERASTTDKIRGCQAVTWLADDNVGSPLYKHNVLLNRSCYL
jgi:hypothetical protein